MRGRTLRLSRGRRFIADLCWISLRMPASVIAGQVCVAPLLAARARVADPPPFSAMVAKAFALLARDTPELRRIYTSWPWPSLFEVEASSASIVVEHELDGEVVVLPVMVKDPASLPLHAIGEALAAGRGRPETVRHLARILRITSLPLPLRRALWWLAYQSGRQRSNYFGTFGITSLGQHGALITVPVSPVTTSLSCGPFGPDGTMTLTVRFDHRVYDGRLVTRMIAGLERTLNGAVLDELSALALADRPTEKAV